MPHTPLSFLVDPATLEARLDDPELLVVDLGPREVYEDVHVPDAVHLDYTALTDSPGSGFLPSPERLRQFFSWGR